jgi:agmatinase
MKVPNNFGGLELKYSQYQNSKIVILPIPFDKTSSWLKGSNKGPAAIIKASQNMELYDIETNSEVYKQGIFTEKEIRAKNSVAMINKAKQKIKQLLNDKKFVVCLGGEHSVSLGPIQTFATFFDNLSVLQLDAHTDLRDAYLGNKYNHASVMARVKEITKNIVSVGIRSLDSSELKNIQPDNIFYAHQIKGVGNWIEKVIGKLTENVYITIDLDVFDPAFMPATGTPEPGGLDWYQVTALLKAVAKNKKIVGFDVVELCPKENKAADFLAAKLIYTLLSYRFDLTNN